MNSALYYPTIEFSSDCWLKSNALFYDKIYRIVPEEVIPSDTSVVKELQHAEVIGEISPQKYASSASRKFLKKIKHWHAAALDEDHLQSEKVPSKV